jgi:hypothetical protein
MSVVYLCVPSEVLQMVLPLIRFPTMTHTEIIEMVLLLTRSRLLLLLE